MTEMTKTKHGYDLEDRTLKFAKEVRALLKKIPRNIANIEDAKQLARSSASVGANYREANEALSKKDFRMRIKICRKEAKECEYWLALLSVGDANDKGRQNLKQEAAELRRIFGSIVENTR